jgi:phospholipase B1
MLPRVITIAWAVLLLLLVVNAEGKLNCTVLPPHTPKDINDLRPNNIKVVMALGDSITAAFGVMGNAGKMDEFRGKSWCIGGDDGALTVPNFLSTWVPDVQGAAKGQHVVEYCTGGFCPNFQYHPDVDKLDAAQSGGMIVNLPQHEMDYLLKQVYNNPAIDIANDWKLLTILIGANDICGCCEINASYTGPDAFEKYLTDTLERVRSTLPRTFVNLILGFNLSEVYNLGRKSLYCEAHQRVFSFECGCIFDKNATSTRTEVDVVTQQYNARIFKIADYYKNQKYSDFAVVIQPFLYKTDASKLPLEFLSTLDCFHPSLFAHEHMAVGLWNNMLTPAAQKKQNLDINDVPLCPTADTLLYTN